MRVWLPAVPVLLAAGLALTGCGGGGSDPPDPPEVRATQYIVGVPGMH